METSDLTDSLVENSSVENLSIENSSIENSSVENLSVENSYAEQLSQTLTNRVCKIGSFIIIICISFGLGYYVKYRADYINLNFDGSDNLFK